MSERRSESGLWLPAVLNVSESNVISTDPEGFSIVLCHCEEGPYFGARKAGAPCCCERCGFMVREQWEALAATCVTTPGDGARS